MVLPRDLQIFGDCSSRATVTVSSHRRQKDRTPAALSNRPELPVFCLIGEGELPVVNVNHKRSATACQRTLATPIRAQTNNILNANAYAGGYRTHPQSRPQTRTELPQAHPSDSNSLLILNPHSD